MKTLKILRNKIDKIDEQIIKLLAKRFKLTERVGIYKTKKHLPLRDERREKKIFSQRKLWAKKLNVEQELVNQIFKLIIKIVRKNHKKILNKKCLKIKNQSLTLTKKGLLI